MSKFTKISAKIEQIILDNPKTPKKQLTWVNINDAGGEEIKFLRKNYQFNFDHLKASIGEVHSQRTSFQESGEYLFIIFHFPVFREDEIKTEEIEFFFSSEYLITIHNKIKDINDLFNLYRKDDQSGLAFKTKSPRILLYEIFKKIMLSSFNLLDNTSKDIDEVEQTIFSQRQKRAVSEILTIRRNIINFRRTMQHHANIIEKIMRLNNQKLIPEEHIRIYYQELLDYSRSMWRTLENQKEVIEILNNTNESMINYKLNSIMKTLTIFSVIIFPLTLLSAIFGMNVVGGMPFIDSPYGFWNLIGVMLLGALVMLGFFKIKKWI